MNTDIYHDTLERERLTSLDTREALLDEIRRGLLRRPRSLAPWMLYDAHGSHLFERVTTVPEYYVTRTERRILASSAQAIIVAACDGRSQPLRLLELGAGTASKTGILLDAAVRQQGEVVYVPMDVSSEALDVACEAVASSLPGVRLQPVVANYVTHPPQLESFDGTTLVMYIGSSIGNFSPQEARTILRNLSSQLHAGDALLLGTDMVKDVSTLLAAYDDNQGITATFDLNILHRLNRELGANFDTTAFRHRALWNRVESRIEMHLESIRDQDVWIAGAELGLHFTKCETIHTENSYKFTQTGIRVLLADAGFDFQRVWTDARGWYTVTLARLH